MGTQLGAPNHGDPARVGGLFADLKAGGAQSWRVLVLHASQQRGCESRSCTRRVKSDWLLDTSLPDTSPR